MARAFTARQLTFIGEYCKSKNGVKAATKAGCPKDSAGQQAYKWLKNPQISAEIDRRLTKTATKLEITAERVLAELAKLAFFDPRKMFNSDGSPKQILDLDDETAACVAGLEVNELFEGDGDQKHAYGLIKKIKLCDKRAALVDLGKHLELFTDKVKVSGTVTMESHTDDELKFFVKNGRWPEGTK